MKVRELNALLNKLAKANPDAQVQLGIPTDSGEPRWVEPYFGATQDNSQLYVIPKEIEDGIELGFTKEQLDAIGRGEVQGQQNQGGTAA